jgi:DNA-directed RNA polymerase subunit M
MGNNGFYVVDKSKSEEDLPKVKEDCPDCGHDTAFFWTKQTRASDEPETKFYRCVKCKKTWREYQ